MLNVHYLKQSKNKYHLWELMGLDNSNIYRAYRISKYYDINNSCKNTKTDHLRLNIVESSCCKKILK